MHSYTLFIVVVLVFSLCLYGCAPKAKGVLKYAEPDVDRVLASLRQYKNELESFKGVGRFKTVRGTGLKSSRVAWIGSQPQNLRVETLGPWGQPTVIFLLNGSSFFLHSRQDNQYFEGDATVENLSRVVSVPVTGEDLFWLLSGQPPILPFHHGKIRTLSGDRGCLLSLHKKWGRVVEKVWLKDDAKTVEKVEVFDGWGDLRYRIVFSEFQQAESFWLPHRIEISDPEGPVCSLMVEKFWTNVSVPEEAFILENTG
jgi:outer membrane biogenesis lipoprotein LolB